MDIKLAKQLIKKIGQFGYTYFNLDGKEYVITFHSYAGRRFSHNVYAADLYTMWETGPLVWGINSIITKKNIEIEYIKEVA
tara:strand:+ start:811 stop:1053 length:243 start_codon:yes stop_codon:yes gene_type:complete